MSDPRRIVPAVDELTERERAILEIAGRDHRVAGAREAAARAELGLNATRYAQLLNAVIDKPAALAANPMLVKRLRRVRAARQARRSTVRRAAP